MVTLLINSIALDPNRRGYQIDLLENSDLDSILRAVRELALMVRA